MTDQKTILVLGTYDTKHDELNYLCERIESQGGRVLRMDVSVLGDTQQAVDYSKHDVANEAGATIEDVAQSGDENTAMTLMAKGAAILVKRLHNERRFDGFIALGGSMGTDLALDCARALPMGVPKYIISTIAFSPLIPAERLAADTQMILWAGGLFGLSSICKSSLSQAAGAVLGAARAVERPRQDRPVVGMMSLGKSCLSYMVTLKPELERRGFEVAIFHATGMGGRAFESLSSEGAFCAVMDFALPELGNLLNGSIINGGKDRLTNAGLAGIPQIVAPGSVDLIDLPTWQEIPKKWRDRPYHAHNRLIASVALTPDERRKMVDEMGRRLGMAKAPVHMIMPLKGIQEWDREGQPAHSPEGMEALTDHIRKTFGKTPNYTEIDAHINDPEFCDAVLAVFDSWVENGVIRTNKA